MKRRKADFEERMVMSRVMRFTGLRLAFSYFLVFLISTDFTLSKYTLTSNVRLMNEMGRRGGLARTSRICLRSHFPGKCVPACPGRAHSLSSQQVHCFNSGTRTEYFFTLDVCTRLGREGVECNPGKPGPSSDSETDSAH